MAGAWLRAARLGRDGGDRFLPTLRRFRQSPVRALALPLIALFYMAATLGSALDHHRGTRRRVEEP